MIWDLELKEYQMNTILWELKWSLGTRIHVLRDRSRRFLLLTREAYIKKIAKQYGIDLDGRLLRHIHDRIRASFLLSVLLRIIDEGL